MNDFVDSFFVLEVYEVIGCSMHEHYEPIFNYVM